MIISMEENMGEEQILFFAGYDIDTYLEFINSHAVNKKDRKVLGPCQKHHIVPKWVGGSDNEDNLVYLTIGDHWEAHKLLAQCCPDNPKIISVYKNNGTKEKFIEKHLKAIES